MAVVTQPRSSPSVVDVVPAAVSRHRRVAATTAIAGVALAVLAGRDGTVGWQMVRVAVVAVLTIAVLAVEMRSGDRGCGRVCVAVGVVTFAIGVGFLPYAVKEDLALEGVAGTIAVVAGIVLGVAGTIVATRGRRADPADRRRRRHRHPRRGRRLRCRSGRRRDQRPPPGDRRDASQQGTGV